MVNSTNIELCNWIKDKISDARAKIQEAREEMNYGRMSQYEGKLEAYGEMLRLIQVYRKKSA